MGFMKLTTVPLYNFSEFTQLSLHAFVQDLM